EQLAVAFFEAAAGQQIVRMDDADRARATRNRGADPHALFQRAAVIVAKRHGFPKAIIAALTDEIFLGRGQWISLVALVAQVALFVCSVRAARMTLIRFNQPDAQAFEPELGTAELNGCPEE